MAEQLIIYLKDSHSLDAEWVFCHSNGELKTPVDTGSIAELADKNKNAIAEAVEIFCIINAELMHFSYQSIPANNMQRALQAIPFVLEEQLAEDIELMHFATSKAEQNIYPVAAIRHECLQQILSSLEQYAIHPDYIYPDVLCLPRAENSWVFFNSDDRTSINQGSNTIIHSDQQMLPLILQTLLQQAGDKLPDSFEVWSSETAASQADFAVPESLQVNRHEYTSAVSLFSTNLNNKKLVNLLQGRYQVVKDTRQWWKPWLLAASLAAVLLCLELVSGIISLNKISNENTLLSAEINRIYKQSFPASKRIVNARVQMESKLKSLQKTSGTASSGFIDILADIAPVIQQKSNIKIKDISYRNRKFEIQVTTDQLSHAESLLQDFNKLQSVKAELISSTSESKRVNARIKLEPL
ncbi:MAG: type II secretion system protein GspL [Gammaproteobacteria bacterium]|nr:type II secretion system protein GspL [Gammaproteobacteria bacterium]